MNGEEPGLGEYVKGQIKWFDPVKGFGFLADAEGGPDVLVHANVLRNFGQSSVVEGALLEVLAIRTPRGRQASEVVTVAPAPTETVAPIADLEPLEDADLQALPLLPARVKWFDRIKGFGFANVFGRKGDVFLHVEVLRRWGFADLQSGEAVGLRVVSAPRGLMAAQVLAWERAVVDGNGLDQSAMDDSAGGAPASGPDPASEPDTSRARSGCPGHRLPSGAALLPMSRQVL